MSESTRPIEEIFAECLAAIEVEGKTIEEALAPYSLQRDELEPLLALSQRLSEARSVVAPAEFRRQSAARMRLLTAARPRPAASPSRRPAAVERVLESFKPLFHREGRFALGVVVALFAALLFGGGGVVYAAGDALPGEALYPVKTAAEQLRLAASLDPAEDLELHLAFATERLEEVATLLERKRVVAAERPLHAYAEQVALAVALVDRENRQAATDHVALASGVSEKLADHEAKLAALLAHAPSQALDGLARAIAATQEGQARVQVGVERGRQPDEDGAPGMPVTITASATPTPGTSRGAGVERTPTGRAGSAMPTQIPTRTLMPTPRSGEGDDSGEVPPPLPGAPEEAPPQPSPASSATAAGRRPSDVPTERPGRAASPTHPAIPTERPALPVPSSVPTEHPAPTEPPRPSAIPTQAPVPTAPPLPSAVPTERPAPTVPPLPSAVPSEVSIPTEGPPATATPPGPPPLPSVVPTEWPAPTPPGQPTQLPGPPEAPPHPTEVPAEPPAPTEPPVPTEGPPAPPEPTPGPPSQPTERPELPQPTPPGRP